MCFSFFRSLFADMTELECDIPTHYDNKGGSLSTLNRCLVSASSYELDNIDCGAEVKGDPVDLFRKGISDHAPIEQGSRLYRAYRARTMLELATAQHGGGGTRTSGAVQ